MTRSFLFLLLFSPISLWPHISSSPVLDSLIKIERYIQDDPARALEQLENNDELKGNSPKEKALYSLLYSMALDKNYIDLQSDSIINRAVVYYAKTKDIYHKALSFYYLGRIFENKEDYVNALNNYISAETFIPKEQFPDYYVRICFAKERIYVRQLSGDMALAEAIKAKEFSRGLANPQFYIRSCLDIATELHVLKDFGGAKQELDSLRTWLDSRNLPCPSDYYYSLIYYYLYDDREPKDSIVVLFDNYLLASKNEGASISPLFYTNVMLRVGDTKEAESMFNSISVSKSYSLSDSIWYYGTASHLYQELRDINNYIKANNTYNRLTETLQLRIYKSDIRILEERYMIKEARAAERRRRLFLSLVVCLLGASLITTLFVAIKRRREYLEAIENARKEYELYRHIIIQEGAAENSIKELITKRLTALAPYFKGTHTKQLKRKDILRLKRDNQEMLRSIGLLFSLSYPYFVSDLVNKGLNAEEIGLCSLYASGYETKELSDLIDSGSAYKINCSIREKLSAYVAGRTLPAWIRDLFNSYSSPSQNA